jgi:Bax protein
MALAQAAEESGWGTSRFVLEGNALFGQYTFGTKYSLIPRAREAGKEHSIKAFPSLLEAVRSYAHNLNTHRAYRKFRDKREILRQNKKEITGDKLIAQLTNYSERGDKYVSAIRAIINVNRLKKLDNKEIQSNFIVLK